MGRARGRALGGDPLVGLGRHRDDRERLLPRDGVGRLRDRPGIGAPDDPPAVRTPRRDRGRVPHAAAVRDPLRDLGRRPRDPLAARPGVPTADETRRPRLLADARCHPSSPCSRSPHDSSRAPRRGTRSARTGSSGAATTRSRSGKWVVYHLGDFTVYLAVVPIAVAPIVLWELGRAGRAGSRPAAAFVALFTAANVSGLLVVAAFTSTPWGYDRLHDRYAFYLLPLWLVGLVVWLASGLPRPAGRGRGRRRRGARASVHPSLPTARERGGNRHRPGRAVGADRGGARGTRAGVRPSRPDARDRRAHRRDLPPAATPGTDRAPRRRRSLVRRDLVLRLGAVDRRARGPRLRRRSRARVDRRAAPCRRARHEAVRRHELRFRGRAACALPDGVLQLDRRPCRLRRRLRPRRAADRALRRGAVGPARALAGDRSSRTTSSRSEASSSPAAGSRREQPRGSCSGRSEVPCASSARPRTRSCAGSPAPD